MCKEGKEKCEMDDMGERSRFGLTLLVGMIASSFLLLVVSCMKENISVPDSRSSGQQNVAKYANRNVLGMNLDPVLDWATQIPFVDAYKQAGSPDSNGDTLLFNDSKGHYPSGNYVITWTGSGNIKVSGDVTSIISQTPGRIVAAITPAHGITLHSTGTVSDIHVWLPGFENAPESPTTFNPTFLNDLQGFSVIRFMDWMNTDSVWPAKTTPADRWADRPLPTDQTWSTGKGVPVEVMVDLANALNANPWFNIPHLADDDYVKNFAQLVKSRLNPGLKPHVEYSNEVWNSLFPQSAYAYAQGASLNLSSNAFQASLRFYSQRAVQIFNIWESVYGGTGGFVRVMGSQFVNTWVSTQVLSWNNAYKSVDALAVAPYFDVPKSGSYTVVSDLENALLSHIDDTSALGMRGQMGAQVKLASQYNLPLITYEGGQELMGSAVASNALCQAVNRDAGMYTLYQHLLSHWMAEGGGLFTLFSNVRAYNDTGSWGAREYPDQTPAQAPKWQAILDFGATGKGF